MTRTLLRRALMAGVAALTTLGLTACGGSGEHASSGTDHGSATTPTAAPSGSAAPGAVFNDADVTFAQMMIVHHRQAVDMAALADGRAGDAKVSDLAGTIKAAQDPEIATMTGWLTAWGKPTSASDGGGHGSGHAGMPGMMSDADMSELKAATGAAFDRQFLTMMIAHHQGAVTMSKEQVQKGSNPEAKTLAQKIITDQENEIAQMNTLLGQL
jgi:uncharacterized protein (DUF305 family)